MRIAQITDLHIGQEGEDTFGIDVRQNLELILQLISRHRVDYIVVSGDLCYRDADSAIFSYVKAQLDQTDIPYFIVPGNHDDSLMLAESFGVQHLLKQNELFFTRTLKGLPILFLDTAVGHLSTHQKNWLSEKVQKIPGHLLVFMHHPPMLAGVPFMDNQHCLQDHEEVLQIMQQTTGRVFVFCGHYHVDKSLTIDKVRLSITPSTFFQIDPTQEDFAVDHRRIAFREIEWDGQLLQDRVVWL